MRWACILSLVVAGSPLLSGQGQLRGAVLPRQLSSPPLLPSIPEANLTVCYEEALAPAYSRTEYPFCEVIEPGVLVLYWSHDASATRPVTKLTIGVAARTEKDYVAIGLSQEAQGMKGMDVAMLRRDEKGGEFRLEDRWSVAYERPRLDMKQDKTLEYLQVEGPLVLFAFSMPVQGADQMECKADAEDALLLSDRWTYVMWAMGDSVDGEPMYHEEDNGMIKLPLLASQQMYAAESSKLRIPENSTTVQIRIPPFEMPSDTDTTYMCMYWPTPQDAKYHIYTAKILGDPDYIKKYVHHMFLYQLHVESPAYELNKPFLCEDAQQGHGIATIMSSHEALTSPSDATWQQIDAAFPLGKGYAKYMLLEVHLNNNDLAAGIVESPGFELTYSPILRKHDAGVFLMGAVPPSQRLGIDTNLILPPDEPAFDFLGYCPSVCTQRLLPDQGVHVIYSRLHMHLLGATGEIQIVRAGAAEEARSRLTYLQHWDNDHQEGTSFEPPGIALHPTDRIITRCTYNTTARNETVYWGDTIQDEMCISYLFVYPVPESAVCWDIRGTLQPVTNSTTIVREPTESAFCATLTDFSSATDAKDGRGYAQYVADHGLEVKISADELNAKEDYEGQGYFRTSCLRSDVPAAFNASLRGTHTT